MKGLPANLVVFDIGESKISAIAAYINKRAEISILSCLVRQAKGFKSGIITDLNEAVNTLSDILYSLESQCGNIKEVSLCFNNCGIKSYFINSKIKLVNNSITNQDVRRIIQKSLNSFKIPNREIIEYFPIEFKIDENNVVKNPVGMYARELSCQMHIITADELTLMNLNSCFAKCQIEVTNITTAVYASSLACLTEEEKEYGALVIDIGSGITSFAVFVNNKMIYSCHVPIGGSSITSDIARHFGIGLNVAEKLKIIHGDVVPSSLIKDNIIRIENFDNKEIYNKNSVISYNDLSDVIRPRIAEIFHQVECKFRNILSHIPSYHIVITGGTSAIRNIKNLAADILGSKYVRVATAEKLPEFSKISNIHLYTTAIGVLKKKQLQYEQEFISDNIISGSLIKKCFNWIKENI